MKKYFTMATSVIAMAALLTACSKKESTETDNDEAISTSDYEQYLRQLDESELEEPEEELNEELVEMSPSELEEEIVMSQQVTELKIVDDSYNRKSEIKNRDEIENDSRQVGVVDADELDDEIKRKNSLVEEVVVSKPSTDANSSKTEPVSVSMVEEMPSFRGGDVAMFKWLSINMNYPSTAAQEGVQGKVTVQFVVEKDGSLSNVRVVRGKHPALDAEAVRVVKRMPKWNPGRNNGEPVRTTFMLPITFKLQQ